MKSGPTKLCRVFADDGEPREARVAQPRQDDVLAPEEHDAGDRERHEADRHGPVGRALDHVEALDEPSRGLAVQPDRALPEVERHDRAEDQGEQPAAVLRERPVVEHAPLATRHLDEDVGLASRKRSVLRGLARRLPRLRRMIPAGDGGRSGGGGDPRLRAALGVDGKLSGGRGDGRRRIIDALRLGCRQVLRRRLRDRGERECRDENESSDAARG